MVCRGEGKPTVILNAGMADWSVVWGRVQNRIAQRTKVCTWDRAGFGFSSASSAPQSVDETTNDLEAALRATKLGGPFVLVGHSLGAYETMLFADRHKATVVGIVLVDPSIPDQVSRLRRVAPEASTTNDRFLSTFVSQRRACADALDQQPDRAPDCTQYGPEVPPAVSSRLARLDRSATRMRTTASLLENFPKDTRLVINAERDYGSIPLTILSASRSFVAPEGASTTVRAEIAREQEELSKGHLELASLSRAGERRQVSDAGHYLQLERPDVVISAVIDVVSKARVKGNR
jgi:pimeloyl-ACP methyl ester carboxylesterase